MGLLWLLTEPFRCVCNPGYVFIPAHVSSPGLYGNMSAHEFNLNATGISVEGYKWSATFTNSAAFTGGKDDTPYSYIKPEDITKGEQALEPNVKQQALNVLNAQIKTTEHWVQTPICVTKDTTDGTPDEVTKSFHVTVSTTCSGEAYDTQAVETAAAQDLTTVANSEFKGAYQPLGEITTTITGVQVLDKQHGTLAVSFTSSGTWVYHFTSAQKMHLAQLISSKSVEDAQKLLLQQADIEHVTITLTHSFWIWNTIPTDLQKIT